MTTAHSASASGAVLSLTAIRVTDLAASTVFYTEGCGFQVERRFSTPGFDAVILRAGPAGIELIAPHETQAPQLGNMFLKLVLNTGDVAGLLARACRHGGSEETPPTVLTEFGGMTIATLRDPDGYHVELVGRPSSAAGAH